MLFDTATLDTRTIYQLLTHTVSPRPIAWISTRSPTGVINLAPFSFFTVASIKPPVLLFTQVNPRDGQIKDTLRNLQANGECVVNVVTHAQAAAMNQSCAPYPYEVSELTAAGLEGKSLPWLATPGVAGAPVQLACRLRQQLQISPEAQSGTVVLLDVLGFAVDDALLQHEQLSAEQLDVIGKMGGDSYSTTRQRFDLARPELAR